MSYKKWEGVPYLDSLRPDFGWKVEFALISSYSVDLRAMVAAMLALAAVDNDRGSGSKVDFANAIETLENRFRVVSQKGRIIAPRKPQKILALMDQFVREVDFNEAQRSWHPKAALVKTVSILDQQIQWRVWIGSRNLTRDTSWDVGLSLVGESTGGVKIAGIADLGFELASRAQLPAVIPEKVRRELQRVSWICPNDCHVDELDLHTTVIERSLPPAPDKLDRLLVVSPFLDGGLVGQLGRWGTNDTHRTILTTQMELSKLAKMTSKPLKHFDEFLVLDAPSHDELELETTEESEDEEPESRGLHAKIILAEHGSGRAMWIGSANATNRGWQGPNAELIAKVTPSKAIAAGLVEFTREAASTVVLDDLPQPGEEDESRKRLEQARKLIASTWGAKLKLDNEEQWILIAQVDPLESLEDVTFSVRALNGTWVDWNRGAKTMNLGRLIAGDESELIFCRVALKDDEISWLQRVPMEPSPTKHRDHNALSRYLDARTFLQWIRSLLHGSTGGDGGGGWDEPRTKNGKALKNHGPEWWCPTLEEVLKAWSKNPGSLADVDRKVAFYFELMKHRPVDEVAEADRRVLLEFRETWQVIRQSLGAGGK